MHLSFFSEKCSYKNIFIHCDFLFQDLLDTVSDNPISSTPASRKESKDQSGARQAQQSHYVSSSAIDVRQLVHNTSNSKGLVRGPVPHKGPLGATKSAAVGHSLASGSGVAGSAGEIRCGSPKKNLGGSTEQLNSASSSRQALSSIGGKYQTQQSAIGRENCAGSVSSLYSTGDAGGQQVVLEPNPRCSTASSTTASTKHGSLLRDRIHRRLNRNANNDQNTTGGCGIRTSSIRMKQALKERLEAWSSDFDRLLRDPAGLQAFSVSFYFTCEELKVRISCLILRGFF